VQTIDFSSEIETKMASKGYYHILSSVFRGYQSNFPF